MEKRGYKKVSTSISIDFENWEYIKEKRINLSEWVNLRIKRELMDKQKKIERLEKEINDKRQEIKKLKEDIEKMDKEKEDYIKNLNKEELEELNETKRILNESGNQFFEGRYMRYKKLYKPEITIDEFKQIIKIINNN